MTERLFALAMILLALLSYRWLLYAERKGTARDTAYVRELKRLLRLSKNKKVKALLRRAIEEEK